MLLSGREGHKKGRICLLLVLYLCLHRGGGQKDWKCAYVIYGWSLRTIIPDCIFITLSLSEDTQAKRVKERHGKGANSTEEILKMLIKVA